MLTWIIQDVDLYRYILVWALCIHTYIHKYIHMVASIHIYFHRSTNILGTLHSRGLLGLHKKIGIPIVHHYQPIFLLFTSLGSLTDVTDQLSGLHHIPSSHVGFPGTQHLCNVEAKGGLIVYAVKSSAIHSATLGQRMMRGALCYVQIYSERLPVP